jgi:hypothetical protein
MSLTFNLAALINVILAAAGVWATLPELRGRPIKLWRLGLPPFFCTVSSIVMLANTTPHLVEFMWVIAGGLGLAAGFFVGRRVKVETDQMWGLVQLGRSYTGLLAASCILLLVLADSVALLMGHGLWSPGQDPVEGAALLAGFLDGRAWKMAATAVRSPHADLNDQ